jgi:hypothetical protein
MLFSTCRNGHPRTDENTYVRPSGGKSCRLCKSESGVLRGKPGFPKNDETCRSGHPRTPGTTYFRANGSRECKVCANIAQIYRRKLAMMRRHRIPTSAPASAGSLPSPGESDLKVT